MLTLTIQNLRGLRHAEWRIDPVTCVVGPNGSGKTTLVLVLRFLRAAWDRDLPTALRSAFGSHVDLRHRDAPADEPISFSLRQGDRSWRLALHPVQGDFPQAEELLVDGDESVVSGARSGETDAPGFGRPLHRNDKLAVRFASEVQTQHPCLEWIAGCLSGMHAFYDYRTDLVRDSVSADMNRHLVSDGRNVATMLRKWLQTREDRFRFYDVRNVMRDAFPGLFHDLDFVEQGTALAMRYFREGDDVGFPAATAAQGHLSLLVTSAAVASTPRGGIVAIDEPEFALHPWAIGVLVRFVVDLAEQRGVRVLMTTHSPVVLNALDPLMPGSVWRLQTEFPQLMPLRLDTDIDWLSPLPLGYRLEHGELGSNDDP